MASDFKLEVFAANLFENHWKDSGILPHEFEVSSMYPEEYHLDPQNTEIFEESHYLALCVKIVFYTNVFNDRFSKLDEDFEASPSYILDYISRTCTRDGLFGDITVFELLFSSCAFVLHLSKVCVSQYGYKKLRNYVHICWVMYFDEYKEEFYRQGGWKQLKIVSDSYDELVWFLDTFPMINMTYKQTDVYIRDAMKVVDTYKMFLSCIHSNSKRISKAWVMLHLQNFNKTNVFNIAEDITKAQDTIDFKVVEKFLLQFRRVIDPKVSEVLNIEAESMFNDSTNYSNEKFSRDFLKLNNLNLNSMPGNTTNDSDIKLKGQDIEETDDQTNTQFAVDSSHSEWNVDQTDELIATDFPRIKDSTNNERLNDTSHTASYLKLEMFSRDDFSRNKIHTTNDQKLKKEHKKEMDRERESPEVKNLLRMILVLRNPSGITRLQSSLSQSYNHQRKKKYFSCKHCY